MNADVVSIRAGKPFRRGVGKCIFCDSMGITKEHMWADWLRKYIPRQLQNHATSFAKYHPDIIERAIVTRTGDPHSRRIKCVCGNCNNGWMSQIQESAKPYIIPLLRGIPVAFSRNSQTILATWITMMVMVAEHLNTEMVSISAEERRQFSADQKPLLNWRIWIGHHAAITHPLFSHSVMSFAAEQEIQRLGLNAAEAANTQTTTILLGKHFLIHVMSSAVAWNIIQMWRLPPEIAAGLVEIWTVRYQYAAWPPLGAALRDPAIKRLEEHFFNACIALARERIASLHPTN
jgi:hypothetical protein